MAGAGSSFDEAGDASGEADEAGVVEVVLDEAGDTSGEAGVVGASLEGAVTTVLSAAVASVAAAARGGEGDARERGDRRAEAVEKADADSVHGDTSLVGNASILGAVGAAEWLFWTARGESSRAHAGGSACVASGSLEGGETLVFHSKLGV